MRDDDSRDHHYEGAGRSADLRFRSAEGRNQEASGDCPRNPRLRREPRGDGEGHGQRKGNQTDGDSGDQVEKEFVTGVVAETEDRLRKPAVVKESNSHSDIMAAAGRTR